MAIIYIEPQRRTITKDGIVYREVYPSDSQQSSQIMGGVLVGVVIMILISVFCMEKALDGKWPMCTPLLVILVPTFIWGMIHLMFP